MPIRKSVISRYWSGTAVAVILSAAVVSTAPVFISSNAVAWAQSEGGGQGNGGQGNGGQGSGGEGGGQGSGGQGSGEGGQGSGQGGPSEDSDGKGPKAGSAGNSGGGKPVWASEGIPEVELGRLSVARSPDQVLDRSLAEALAGLTPEMVSYYNLSLEEAVAALSLSFEETTFIDSPLQNLALLKDSLDGTTVLADSGVTNDLETLQAMLLGAASDKTVPISTDTVIAVTTILGTPITGDAAAALAADAEAIRVAILAGHG